jgi:hypothetical protein
VLIAKMAVTVALAGTLAAATAVSAFADNPPTGPNDPSCIADPTTAECMNGPWGLPTSPSSVGCAINPGQGICLGGPYKPPAIGAGTPGGMGGVDMGPHIGDPGGMGIGGPHIGTPGGMGIGGPHIGTPGGMGAGMPGHA